MEFTYITSALIFGLITGFHCIGMCGPIALSLGLDAQDKLKFHSQNAVYQFGRITTYTIFGLLFGLIGKGLNLLIYQKYIGIAAGIILILMVLLPGKVSEIGQNFSFFSRMMIKVKIFLSNYIRRKDFTSRYITGILNGLLPCGPVYIALTASIAAGSILKSATYMMFFGLGTLPFMFATVIAGNLISQKFRSKVFKVYPYIIVLIGCLFILRNLGLGIPFISPPEEALHIKATKSCCH